MAPQVMSLDGASLEQKRALLKGLDYDIEGAYVLDEEGDIVKDPCTGKPVEHKNMALFPGSAIVLDDNPVSIAWYLETYRSDD